MPCPPGSIHSFVNFQGPLGPIFNDFSGNNRVVNGAPFQINFAPRSTPLTNIQNYIQEDPQNTLLYKQTVYTLASTQICQPSSKSYSLLGLQGPGPMLGSEYSSLTPYSSQPYSEVPTIIFTYISPGFNGLLSSYTNAIRTGRPVPTTPTQPLIMLLIIPIYTGSSSSVNAQYLTQLKPSTDSIRGTYPSMKDLLKDQQSIGYPGCLDFILGGSALSVPTNFYTFPMGIVINDATYASLKPLLKIRDFTIEQLPIVKTYDLDGKPIITDSTTTNIPITLSPIGDKYLPYMQRYTKGPAPSSFVNPNLKPEQYQCYPFNELQNIDPDSGTVMNLGEAINVNNTQNNKVGSMIQWDTISGLVGGIAGVIGVFILLTGILYLLSYLQGRQIPVTAPVTAPVTTSVTAPVTAPITGASVTGAPPSSV